MKPEIVYDRSLTGSYMKIAAAQYSPLDEEILLSRQIEGLLPVQRAYRNGERWYWYNISGEQSLDTYCRCSAVDMRFLQKLIGGICEEISILERNLFDSSCLLLDPETIFIQNTSHRPAFTLYPGGGEELPVQFRELVEYLLTKLDHGDAQAVSAAYGIYEKTLEEGYEIREISELLGGAGSAPEERPPQEEAPMSRPKSKEEADEPPKARPGGFFSEIRRDFSSWRSSRRHGFSRKDVRESQLAEEAVPYGRERAPYGNEPAPYGRERAPYGNEPAAADYVTPLSAPQWEEPGTTVLGCYADYTRGILKKEDGREDESILLPKKAATIGKSACADIVLDKDTVSQFHARVTCRDGSYYLEDLNSTNGTFVNGEPLLYKEERKLQENDRIRFADVAYRFL